MFGGLAWYFYPEDLLSKPLASLNMRELVGIFGWFGFLAFVFYGIWERLRD